MLANSPVINIDLTPLTNDHIIFASLV